MWVIGFIYLPMHKKRLWHCRIETPSPLDLELNICYLIVNDDIEADVVCEQTKRKLNVFEYVINVIRNNRGLREWVLGEHQL